LSAFKKRKSDEFKYKEIINHNNNLNIEKYDSFEENEEKSFIEEKFDSNIKNETITVATNEKTKSTDPDYLMNDKIGGSQSISDLFKSKKLNLMKKIENRKKREEIIS